MRCGFRRLITVAGLLCVLGGLVSRLNVWWVWCLTRLLGVRVGCWLWSWLPKVWLQIGLVWGTLEAL